MALWSNAYAFNCFSCKYQGHQTKDCKDSISLEVNTAKLKDDGRCFNCTTKKHRAKTAVIRFGAWPAEAAMLLLRTTQPIREVRPEYRNVRERVADGHQYDIVFNGKRDGHMHNSVLLQTLRICIMTMDKCGYVRWMLDNGTQRRFIREVVSRRLRLTVLGGWCEYRRFWRFIRTAEPSQESGYVVLQSPQGKKKHEIVAIEVLVICRDVLEYLLSAISFASYRIRTNVWLTR